MKKIGRDDGEPLDLKIGRSHGSHRMMMMFSGVGKVIARIHFHPGTHFTVLLSLTYFYPSSARVNQPP